MGRSMTRHRPVGQRYAKTAQIQHFRRAALPAPIAPLAAAAAISDPRPVANAFRNKAKTADFRDADRLARDATKRARAATLSACRNNHFDRSQHEV